MPQQFEWLKFIRPAMIPWALTIIVAGVVVARVVSSSLVGLGERFADKRLLINQAASFVRFGIYLLTGLGAAAMVLELSDQMILALGGTAAVSIGFALKDLVASFIAGLIILIDRPFQVGDRVTFEGEYGEIKHIGLRSVRLVTLDDSQVTIPNNKFLTESVTSGNAGEIDMMIQVDFLIGADQDFARAKRIVEEALTASQYIQLRKRWVVLVTTITQDGYFAIQLRAKAYVLDVVFEKAFESDVSERVLEGFRDSGIQPPALLHRTRDPSPA